MKTPKTSAAPADSAALAVFSAQRERLLALGYRFLGSFADAEDIVQETYLRWARVDPAKIDQPAAFLMRTAARLCLDQLKSARARRERYVGPWLPEPIVEEISVAADAHAERADDISVALLLALERLSPLERATFVLHDVFGQPFTEIAQVLDRTPATCRQLAKRARDHLRTATPRYRIPTEEHQRITREFLAAARSGDAVRLGELLAQDAVLHSDGGGKVRAALRIIAGRDRIARLFASLGRRFWQTADVRLARINGQIGVVMRDSRGATQTLALDCSPDGIAALYLVRNPDKLRRLTDLEHFPKYGSRSPLGETNRPR